MKHLLSADFYRLVRSKSLYICTIILGGLMAVNLLLLKILILLTQSSGVDMSELAIFPYHSGFETAISMLGNTDITLFMGILVSILICAEFSHGTMKNPVSKGYKRSSIYFTKFIMGLEAYVVLSSVTFVVSFLMGILTTGEVGSFDGEMLQFAIRTIGVEFLLQAAFISVFVMVTMSIRNIGGCIAINICMTTFSSLVYQLLNVIFRNKYDFAEYSILQNISTMAQFDVTTVDVVRAVIISAVYFAIATISGILIFKHSDIK